MRRIALLIVVLAVAACSEQSTPVQPDTKPQMAMVPVSVAAAPAISTLTITVSASDITTDLVFNVTMTNGEATDTITIPAGSDRLITVRGYDAGNIETHRGSKTVNLIEGVNPQLTVVLQGLTGDQPLVVALGETTVAVTPESASVFVGGTTQLSAVVTDEAGDTLQVGVRWASTHPAIATVDQTGLVTGVSSGPASVIATYDGVGASATITAADAFYVAANGVTVVCTDAQVGQSGVVNGVTYTKRDRAGLDALVAEGKSSGDYSALATTCTSGVTDISSLFHQATSFNEPIGTWDVSDVQNMAVLFFDASSFDQDIGAWNVSNVVSMWGTFSGTYFNQDISRWDVSKVGDMGYMFRGAVLFNQDLSSWEVGAVTNMEALFMGASSFNQPIGSWNVSSATVLQAMFNGASAFHQDISAWDVSSVTNMAGMFDGASVFNQDMSAWNVGSVTNMSYLFRNAIAFNQDISAWDVGSVTNMSYMFFNARAFNQPLGAWDVSSVTDMAFLFQSSAFDQDIGGWNVSNVTTLQQMFFDTPFNQDIGGWDVSGVENMWGTFQLTSAFNRDISGWDVSNVTNMRLLFGEAAAFDQPIGAWDVSAVTNMARMFESAGSFNQDLSGWCVSLIPAAPVEDSRSFDGNSTSWTRSRPVWGTCSPASLYQSTLTASSTSIPADGASTVTLTVQLKDVDGVNLTENTRTLTFDTPTQGSISAVTVNNDGTFTATYTAGSTAGTVTVTASLDGVAMTQTVTITLN